MTKEQAAELLQLGLVYTKSDVMKAFRKHGAKHHPDKGGDNITFIAFKTARDLLLEGLFVIELATVVAKNNAGSELTPEEQLLIQNATLAQFVSATKRPRRRTKPVADSGEVETLSAAFAKRRPFSNSFIVPDGFFIKRASNTGFFNGHVFLNFWPVKTGFLSIENFDGDCVKIYVPAMFEDGDTLRIKNKGYWATIPRQAKCDKRGDLFVVCHHTNSITES